MPGAVCHEKLSLLRACSEAVREQAAAIKRLTKGDVANKEVNLAVAKCKRLQTAYEAHRQEHGC